MDIELRRFLPTAYDLKLICDYEVGPDAVVPPARATAAVETAERFVGCITTLAS